jgi:hypothetical protein
VNDDITIENDLPPGMFIPERADLAAVVRCCRLLLVVLYHLHLDRLLTPFEIEIIEATAQVVKAVKIKYDLKEI